ncbi:molybdenum cofactor guanylyltransferase [Aliidiomarina indica]|uniref:molybdenum cofactor guanylyltransferase n=1 Tax=Aliidiomarina indica TaxID=2749147 RepID=UPI00188E75C6|nr:molybdenum cofactor guanylyltransferase [Aliidiomarina indica]
MGTALNVSCILLAGGKSSRMGVDKALLSIESECQGEPITLLEYMQRLISDSGIHDLVVSRSNQLPGPRNARYPWIDDTLPNRGPLSGIRSCLPHCKHARVLVLPVDMPDITVPQLRQLARAPTPGFFLQSALPCILENDATLMKTLSELLDATERGASVRALLHALHGKALATPEETMDLPNLNTPSQWDAFMQRSRGRLPYEST